MTHLLSRYAMSSKPGREIDDAHVERSAATPTQKAAR